MKGFRSLFFLNIVLGSSFIWSSSAFADIQQKWIVKLETSQDEQSVLHQLKGMGLQINEVLDREKGLYSVSSHSTEKLESKVFTQELNQKYRSSDFSTRGQESFPIKYLEEDIVYHSYFGSRKPSDPVKDDPKDNPGEGLGRSKLDSRFPNDTYFSEQWALFNEAQKDTTGYTGINEADIWAPYAWNQSYDSSPTLVAILDTGVDMEHPDLAANMARDSAGEVIRYNAISSDNNVQDKNGHGTHCAGIVGARGNNQIGIAGVAWRSRMIPVQFMDESGSGALSAAIRGIRFAVDSGARVINASWGSYSYSESLAEMLEWAQSKGVLVVVAAGNSGTDNDTRPSYPADYPFDNIISVGATDNRDRLASFSNYGATKVDIAAPGVGILSTVPNEKYAGKSGTSMAAPYVAGAIALVWSKNPSWSYQKIRQYLFDTSDSLPALKDKIAGGRRLNLYRLLKN